VYFENTMPPNIESISEIPNTLLGAYLCDSDNDMIYAENRLIYMMSYDQFVTSLDEINQTESCNFLNGELFLPNREECVPFEYLSDDKIRVTLSSIDTLFAFRKNEVAKMYKNRLFLNVKGELEEEWITYMISKRDHGVLLWERIEVPDEKEYLKSLTYKYETIEYQETEDKYVINPTLIEFDEFLEKEFTLECDVLIPINAEFKN
tara:strand:- start:516 stop:1133 length:618 start_codon:yes stop_codon:yes gene_type:complete